MNTAISFETSKLLKEKGYNEPCGMLYNDNGTYSGTKMGMGGYPNNYINKYSAPTIAEVLMWLYEKYGIWIEVHGWTNQPVGDELWKNCFQAFVNGDAMNVSIFQTPTEAYEAAIVYTLNHLI